MYIVFLHLILVPNWIRKDWIKRIIKGLYLENASMPGHQNHLRHNQIVIRSLRLTSMLTRDVED